MGAQPQNLPIASVFHVRADDSTNWIGEIGDSEWVIPITGEGDSEHEPVMLYEENDRAQSNPTA